MITAESYSDWTHFAGLYLRSYSKAERYQTFAKLISPAGLTIKIVYDFLQGNPGGIDLQAWRNGEVYERGAEAQERIEMTARSLEAIGAPRIAAGVRAVQDTSIGGQLLARLAGGASSEIFKSIDQTDVATMMEELRNTLARAAPEIAAKAGLPPAGSKPVPVDPAVESHEKIEHLLTRYVEAHQLDLQDDLRRYGDPRREPGFTPEGRQQELDRQQRRMFDLEQQKEQSTELESHLAKLAEQLATHPEKPLSKHRQAIRAILGGVKKYAACDSTDLIPAIQRWLDRATRFVHQHPSVFHPNPVDDPALLERLSAIGEYDVDLSKSSVTLSWDSPQGLECPWTPMSLEITFPPKDEAACSAALDRVERIASNWSNHLDDLQLEILENFAMYEGQLPEFVLEDYERDDDGSVMPDSILANCGGGTISINATEEAELYGEAGARVFFGIEWDDEHGLELWIDEDQGDDDNYRSL